MDTDNEDSSSSEESSEDSSEMDYNDDDNLRLIRDGRKRYQEDNIFSKSALVMYAERKSGDVMAMKRILEMVSLENTKMTPLFLLISLSLDEKSNDIVSLLMEYAEDKKMEAEVINNAAMEANLQVMKMVMERGWDIEEEYCRMQAIHTAAEYGQEEVVKYLLEKGVSVAASTIENYHPLHFACQQGHTSIVELLLKNGADINAQTGFEQSTPLMEAAKNGKIAIASMLIDAGADVEVLNRLYQKAIHYAVYAGHLEMVKFLLDNGVLLNSNDAIRELFHASCGTCIEA